MSRLCRHVLAAGSTVAQQMQPRHMSVKRGASVEMLVCYVSGNLGDCRALIRTEVPLLLTTPTSFKYRQLLAMAHKGAAHVPSVTLQV